MVLYHHALRKQKKNKKKIEIRKRHYISPNQLRIKDNAANFLRVYKNISSDRS